MSWLKSHFVGIQGALFLLLLAMAGVLAARITWLLLAPPPAHLSPDVPVEKVTASSIAVDRMTLWHLFGQSAAPEQQAAAKIRASSLGVKLEGIISGSPSPLVMMRVGGVVRLLQVGDTLSGGVRIVSISPEQVVLSNQGRLESIAFPESESLNQASVPTAAALDASVRHVGQSSSGRDIQVQAAKILHNPQSLLAFVSVSPVQHDGVVKGYMLRPVPGQESFMQALGLKPGDVLTSVDGMPVSDPATLPRIMPLLNSGRPLQVLVERGGQPLSLTINLGSL